MDVLDRAGRYLAKMDPSVSGADGHTAAFKAAVALVQGFDLGDAAAMQLLRDEFNPRCQPPWSERELRHKVRQAAQHGQGERGYLLKGSAGGSGSGGRSRLAAAGGIEPERNRKRADFDREALARASARGMDAGRAWLAERSPIDPRGVSPGEFLDHLFKAGERSLIFTNLYGQGEYGHVAGMPGRTYRLGRRPGMEPQRGEIPGADRCGVWFLPVPVDGRWHPTGAVDDRGQPLLSRRSGKSVQAWRHMLLESDEAGETEWLRMLVQLPLPISALYTSGGRSVHALVRIDAASKGRFDEFRDRFAPFISKLGGDAAAMTGVRLTRLPGVFRNGTEKQVRGRAVYTRYEEPRLQRLLYLNPDPEVVALQGMARVREVKGNA